MSALSLEHLIIEYHHARAHSERLLEGLSDEQIMWRPHAQSSAIAWHLGHQAAVNHFMVRNLTTAEPSFNPAFDSATPEPERGELPNVADILGYRTKVATSTESIVDRIVGHDVGAPAQLSQIAIGLLTAVINHEYQHDTWILGYETTSPTRSRQKHRRRTPS